VMGQGSVYFSRKNSILRLPADVSRSEREVLRAILDAGPSCYRGRQSIARDLGVSRATVARALSELKAKRLITIEYRPGLKSVIHGEWDLVETYGRPVYVQPSLLDQPPLQMDDRLPTMPAAAGVRTNESTHHEPTVDSPCTMSRLTMHHESTHHESTLTVISTVKDHPKRNEDEIGGVVDSFYRMRNRPRPAAAQRAKESAMLADFVADVGLDVVVAAIERLVGPAANKIADRELLAGCMLALRSEIARITKHRQSEQLAAQRAAEDAQRAAIEADRRAVEEASWAVAEREWDGLQPEEKAAIHAQVLARSLMARSNASIARQLCVGVLRDRDPPRVREMNQWGRKSN
jgi:DNA-binding transcriptional ArsR family regulator